MWNRHCERLAHRWSQISRTYATMHNLCATNLRWWNYAMSIPAVLLSAVATTSIFTTEGNEQQVWNYVNGSASLVVTCLTSLSNFLDLQERAYKHRQASVMYHSLAIDIECMIALPEESRKDCAEWMRKMQAELGNARRACPEISAHVLSKHVKMFDKAFSSTACTEVLCVDSERHPVSEIAEVSVMDAQVQMSRV
jgi:hypothetical protein